MSHSDLIMYAVKRLPSIAGRPVCANFSSRAKNSATSPNQYCVDLVRTHDFENFLSTLLINGQAERRGAFAVRAFNVEIAKIAGSVSDDKIGQMRLRFWTDSLNRLYDKDAKTAIPEHPVIYELNRIVTNHKVKKLHLQRLIQARQRTSNMMFETVEQLEQYVETSTSSIYYVLLKIFGTDDMNADHAASHLGKAQGIANMIRTLVALRGANGRGMSALPPIPQEILLRHGCSYEQILRQRDNAVAVQDCLFDVASVAKIHLEKSRSLSDKLSRATKLVLLPAISVDRFLTRLQIANFQLTNPRLAKRDSLLPLALFWNKMLRKY